MSSSALQVQLSKRHSSGRFHNFRLETKFIVFPGVTVIVGHSGAGKTTNCADELFVVAAELEACRR